MEIDRSPASWIGSKPSHCPLPIKPGLSFLIALVAEMPVDPFNHRHGGSRHTGDQENVNARHEHLADPEMAERVDRDGGADAHSLAHRGRAIDKQDARVAGLARTLGDSGNLG